MVGTGTGGTRSAPPRRVYTTRVHPGGPGFVAVYACTGAGTGLCAPGLRYGWGTSGTAVGTSVRLRDLGYGCGDLGYGMRPRVGPEYTDGDPSTLSGPKYTDGGPEYTGREAQYTGGEASVRWWRSVRGSTLSGSRYAVVRY